VTFFRRREPLHDRLAREGGLTGRPVSPPDLLGRLSGAGIHGLQRLREWDAVVTVDAPPLQGDRATFVSLPDGTLLVEDGDERADLAPLAAAVEAELEPPYRAEAVRRQDTLWAVAARQIEVVALADDPGGDELTLTLREGERELIVDRARTFGSIPALEQLASARFESYVIRAARLDGDLWELDVSPL
jgi:hypothetical protein